jgi:Ca-activated chloride channel homolog
VTIPSFISPYGRIAWLVVAPVLLLAAWGQDSTGDVHVAPRVQGQQTNNSHLDNPELRTHTAPIKVDVNLVLVPVSVVDLLNRQVTGLEKQNFAVFENKQRQEIRYFSSEDAPISLGAIFDSSGSMADKIDRAREAMVEFFKTANPQDEFFMIAFADTLEQVTDFTQSVGDIQGKLPYTVPKGRTALLDAIHLGLIKMRQAKYQRKALLIISDGGDNHSRYTESEIKNLVKESDVQIYAIGIYGRYFPTQEELQGPQLLGDIADLTGGRAFSIVDPNDLVDVATKIGIELRNQYLLAYRPNAPIHDGKWHKIRVKLNPAKGLPALRVYAKTGYYAPSE